MSAPVRELDPGLSKDEPSKYAPKKARNLYRDQRPAGAKRKGDSAFWSAAQASAGTSWKRPHQHGTAFLGDVAIAELRTKRALAADRLPDPPAAASSNFVWACRFAGVGVVAACLVGCQWQSSPSAPRLQLPHPSHHAEQPVSPDPSDSFGDRWNASLPSHARRPVAPERMTTGMVPSATVVNAAPAVYPPPPKASLPPPDGWVWRQLTVGAVGMQQEDEIAPVTISVAGAGPSATVMISDLAPGSAPEAQQPPTQQAQPPTEAQQPETLPRDAEWTVFHEPSLGTSLALPAAVLSVSDGHAHRGVGRRFKTPDGRAKVAIYAQHNMQHDTPASHLRKTFTFPRTSLDYERVTPDFFAVSGVSGGTIYYIRCNMAPAGEAFHCFELTYPAREKKAWDGIVTRMSRSLRAARSRSAEGSRGALGLARPSVAPWFLARATRP